MTTATMKVPEITTPTCLVCDSRDQIPFMTKVGYSFQRCQKCGLEYIYPQPNDQQLANIYGAQYFQAWDLDTKELLTAQMKKSTFARILNLVSSALPSKAKILDLGCASGFFLSVVQEQGFDPYGVEISEAAKKCVELFGDAHIYQGILEEATFAANPSRQFDAIFMTDYIEHVRDPRLILSTVRGMLTEKGYIVVTTPKVKSFSYTLMGQHWTQYKAEHLFYFSPQNLMSLLKSCGFGNFHIYPAYKCMILEFLLRNFVYYKTPVITPLAKLLLRIIPDRILNQRFWVTLGDMIIVAHPEPKESTSHA